MMKTLGTVLAGGLTAAVIAALMPQPNLSAAASCESLSSLRLSDTTITMAQARAGRRILAAGHRTVGGRAGIQ